MNIRLNRIYEHTFISNALNEESIVLDLGANAGLFASSVNSQWGCTVHAVEPTAVLANSLRKIPGLVVHEAAVNGHGGNVLFRIDPLNSESSCVVSETDDMTTVVQGTTLEALLLDIGSIGLLKMDVEGEEISILNNTPKEVLMKIPQITVEFHDFKIDSGVTEEMVYSVFDRMKELGFEVYVNSFWTKGDVLFINQRFFKTTAFSRLILSLQGRWFPGIVRILSRYLSK